MRRTFSFSFCSFGVFVFLPWWFPDAFSELCFLFSCAISSSSSPQILRFCFSFLYFQDFAVRLSAFFLVAVQPFSSRQLPHLFFGLLLVLLYCLCFSPFVSVSAPPTGFSFGCYGVGFCSWGCCGSYGSSCCSTFVLSFAATLSSAPPFRLLWLQLYPLSFFLISRSWLLLPVSLCVFPHAAAPAAPSRLPPCFSTCLRLQLLLPVFLSVFHWLRLLPALCGVAPVALLVADYPDVVPRGSCFCASQCFYSLFLSGLSQVSLVFHHPCFLRLRALPLCLLFLVLCWRFPLLRLLFLLSRCTFSLFECPCCFLWGFCLVRISGSVRNVVSLCNESGFAAPSSQACFWWSFPFLCGFPFCSSDSFASKVPLATWSPFGTSPTSFGVLSLSGSWFSPAVLPFPLIQVAFALQSLPWYLSAVADFGLCGVSTSLDVLCLLFVFYTQFGVLSSLVGHSSSVPLPPLSLGV